MNGSQITLMALLLASFFSISPAPADELIGRWRDKLGTMYDAAIEIRKEDEGSYYQLRYDNTGNTPPTRFELIKQEGAEIRFLVVDSPFDDDLRIRRDGNLGIFDQGVLLRIAQRID